MRDLIAHASEHEWEYCNQWLRRHGRELLRRGHVGMVMHPDTEAELMALLTTPPMIPAFAGIEDFSSAIVDRQRLRPFVCAAAAAGCNRMLAWLLGRSPSAAAVIDATRRSPFYYACVKNNAEAMRALADVCPGVSVIAPDVHGANALHALAFGGISESLNGCLDIYLRAVAAACDTPDDASCVVQAALVQRCRAGLLPVQWAEAGHEANGGMVPHEARSRFMTALRAAAERAGIALNESVPREEVKLDIEARLRCTESVDVFRHPPVPACAVELSTVDRGMRCGMLDDPYDCRLLLRWVAHLGRIDLLRRVMASVNAKCFADAMPDILCTALHSAATVCNTYGCAPLGRDTPSRVVGAILDKLPSSCTAADSVRITNALGAVMPVAAALPWNHAPTMKRIMSAWLLHAENMAETRTVDARNAVLLEQMHDVWYRLLPPKTSNLDPLMRLLVTVCDSGITPGFARLRDVCEDAYRRFLPSGVFLPFLLMQRSKRTLAWFLDAVGEPTRTAIVNRDVCGRAFASYICTPTASPSTE